MADDTATPSDPSQPAAPDPASDQAADQPAAGPLTPAEPLAPSEPEAAPSGDASAADTPPADVTPAPTPGEPAVALTLEVPPLDTPAVAPVNNDQEGGEWDLLVSKVQDWLNSGQLQQLWSTTRTPLTALAAFLGLLLVLRIYGSLLEAINSLPLVPGLLELTGVIWLVRFGIPKLLRRSEREKLISGLQRRRQDFLG